MKEISVNQLADVTMAIVSEAIDVTIQLTTFMTNWGILADRVDVETAVVHLMLKLPAASGTRTTLDTLENHNTTWDIIMANHYDMKPVTP